MESHDGGEVDICRVCRGEGNNEKPLFHPCMCTGSIKFIHQECLVQWLNHSKKEFCELCKHKFVFKPIYAPDMPRTLPFADFLQGLGKNLAKALKYWLHYTLVAVAWLGVVPLTSYRVYRCFFAGSLSSLLTLPLDILSTNNLLADCLKGCCVVGCSICAFIVLVWLREQIVVHGGPDWLEGPAEPLRPMNLPGVARGLFGGVIGGQADGNAHNQNQANVPEVQVADAENLDPENQNEAFEDNEELEDDGEEADNEEADNEGAHAVENEGAENEPVAPADEWNPEWERAAEDLTWERFLGLDGSLVFLEHVFWIISLNTSFILVFGFCPFHIGHFALHMLSVEFKSQRSEFDSLLTCLVGYFAQAVSLLVLHTLAGLCRFKRLKRILGLCYVVIKVALIMVVEVGIFPLICGWWIDICSLPLFAVSLKDRQASFLYAPGTATFLHWLVGMLYVFYFASFVILLRESQETGIITIPISISLPFVRTITVRCHKFHSLFPSSLSVWTTWQVILNISVMKKNQILINYMTQILRPGVLWFLRNLNDPDFHPMQEMIHLPVYRHIRRFAVSLIVFGTAILIKLWIPVQLIRFLFPNFLPFNYVLTSDIPVSELPLELLLLQVVLPALLEQAHTRQWIKNVVRLWVVAIAYLLDFRSYLLGDVPLDDVDPAKIHHQNANIRQDNQRGNNAAAGNNAGEAGQIEPQPYIRPSRFAFRITLFLIMMSASLVVSSFLGLTVPVAVGRQLLSYFLGNADVHELYTAAAGIYTLWLICRVGVVITSWISMGLPVFLKKTLKWLGVAFRLAFLSIILFGIIPLLLGVIFELVFIIPLRVPLDQTPLFFLWQDWALGVLHTKIVCALVMVGPNWWLKTAMEQVYQDGVHNIRLFYVINKLAYPAVASLLSVITVPYVLTNGLLPLIGVGMEFQLTVYRRIYPFILVVFLMSGTFVFQGRQFHSLYEKIKNDKYLVGQRLVNYYYPSKKNKDDAAGEYSQNVTQ